MEEANLRPRGLSSRARSTKGIGFLGRDAWAELEDGSQEYRGRMSLIGVDWG